MREFFKTKKDIEERIRNNVRNIAFYADNLTKKDCILVDSFLKSAEKNYHRKERGDGMQIASYKSITNK